MSCSSGPKIITEGLVFNLDPSNSKSYPAINDPYRNDVSILLPFDGANNSTTFTDFSINNLTVTANGNAQISTAKSKFGGSSAAFDGNGDFLTTPNSSLFSFGTGDFTIEAWINYSVVPGSGVSPLCQTDAVGVSTNDKLWIGYGNGVLYINTHGYNGISVTCSWTPTTNTWYHIAVQRKNGTLSAYINGVAQTLSNPTGLSGVSLSQNTFAIGAISTPYYFNGYIDDFRVTKAARYTANFTPPDRLTALPGRIYDLTTNKITSTLTNGPVFSNVQNGVISFDASNDWISLPASSPLTFGTGDFTIDVWYKPRAKTNSYPLIIGNNLTWQANQWSLVDRHMSVNPTKFSFFVYNYNSVPALLVSSTAPSNNNWYNLTITRVGSTFSMYVNGILDATATSAASLDGGVSYTVAVGGDSVNGGTTIIDGNIGNLRIYKGKGLSATEVSQNYVGNRQKYVEIPRTFSGLAVWFDGLDLCTLRQNSNATTAAILNSDPVGYWSDKSGNGRNATQATAGNRAALATGARNLDPAINFAANNWLDLAAYTASFGTGDFTIEGWIKPTGYSGTSVLLSTGMNGMAVYFSSGGILQFGKYGVGTFLSSTAAISTTSWTKFAITRSGTSLKLFLNDVLNASATDSSSYTGGSAMRIGFDAYSPTGNTKYNGLLQNLLIYEGFSKYN